MEVLLLQDVANVGRKNDLLVVGDGYALNCLLPSRLAIVATPVVRKRYADAIKRRAEERERERQLKMGLASALAGKSVSFTKKTTKTGKLYAAISAEALAEALKTQLGIEIAAGLIEIPDAIKATGTFPAYVKLGGKKEPLNVIVTAEAETKAKK